MSGAMLYHVKASFKADAAREFHRLLTDGTIAAQQPDGREIVDSMHRARITSSRTVEWTERCFCAVPLAHERETVYDRFFDQLQIHPLHAPIEIAGTPFMDYLAGQTNGVQTG